MIDPYSALKPLLFCIDAERAHHLTIGLLKTGLAPRGTGDADPILQVKLCGLTFPNPVGLAAGFDKHAEIMGPMLGLGFGSIEVGSITPQPQPGNPKPRLFRVPQAEGIINRFGFNSDGFDICEQRLKAWRASGRPGIVGVNIGKNKDTVEAADDYAAGVRRFAPLADYLTVNISSPNTPGLRDLQNQGLDELLRRVLAARAESTKQPPLFVKIAPDLSDEQMDSIAATLLPSGIDGVIIGNTTISRPSEIPSDLAKEAGGLSGKPLFPLSTRMLARLYRLTGGKLPLIGCGGISSGVDAYAKIRAGASLVQLYSAMVYQGPSLAARVARELALLLRQDGFKSIAESVGTANP